MKVTRYARVSIEDRAKEGVSLEARQALIKAYCTAKVKKALSIPPAPASYSIISKIARSGLSAQ
jgi:hypothetical protein